jgi:hypothetical protein
MGELNEMKYRFAIGLTKIFVSKYNDKPRTNFIAILMIWKE